MKTCIVDRLFRRNIWRHIVYVALLLNYELSCICHFAVTIPRFSGHRLAYTILSHYRWNGQAFVSHLQNSPQCRSAELSNGAGMNLVSWDGQKT